MASTVSGSVITADDCFKRYGLPDISFERRWMVLFVVPQHILAQIGALPRRIYCNRDIVAPLQQALQNIVDNDLAYEFRTWDGCFCIRNQRGSNRASLHSWGIAIDINAAWNRFGQQPTLSDAFVSCFEKAGFTWGGRWRIKDGMHFQIAEFPHV